MRSFEAASMPFLSATTGLTQLAPLGSMADL
jgi:hypothetical protein